MPVQQVHILNSIPLACIWQHWQYASHAFRIVYEIVTGCQLYVEFRRALLASLSSIIGVIFISSIGNDYIRTTVH